MQRVIAAYRSFLSAVVPERHMVRGFIARHLGNQDAAGLCLDIGAGTAPFAGALRQALPRSRYVAIDRIPSEPVDLIADATSLPLPTGSASFACFFQVLSHVPDMAGALAEVRRVLAPDGQILIVYPFLIPECRSRDLWRWTMPGMERVRHRRARAAGRYPVLADRHAGGSAGQSADRAPDWLAQRAWSDRQPAAGAGAAAVLALSSPRLRRLGPRQDAGSQAGLLYRCDGPRPATSRLGIA